MSSDCRLKKKVESKLHPATMNPILEASFGDRYSSYKSPEYTSYEREVGIPVGKFYVGLPALL